MNIYGIVIMNKVKNDIISCSFNYVMLHLQALKMKRLFLNLNKQVIIILNK